MTTRPEAKRQWCTSSSTKRTGDVRCPLGTHYIPAWKPACQKGTGRTCGECAAHHGPPGEQVLLPLDERHGVEQLDPLPW